MKNCPTCGVRLTDSLVDAINNPSRTESCPKAKRKVSNVREPDERQQPSLETLMLLGSLMQNSVE